MFVRRPSPIYLFVSSEGFSIERVCVKEETPTLYALEKQTIAPDCPRSVPDRKYYAVVMPYVFLWHVHSYLHPTWNRRGAFRSLLSCNEVVHFFLPPEPVAVIFDVDIRSPIYFCRNLLLLSSLSCSSLTASIRLKISSRDFCRTFACSFNWVLASWLIFSRSWLLLRGLMALASSSSNTSSPSFNSTLGCSRGTMMVPLDFLVPSFGRWRDLFEARPRRVLSPLIEDDDDEVVLVDGELGSWYSDSVTWGILEAILLIWKLQRLWSE